MSVTLTSKGLARADALTWNHRGATRVTVVAQAGFRLDPNGLVPDSSAYRITEASTPALMHPEVIVDGPGGWMRVWRGEALLMDKSFAAGTAARPSIAPERVARLGGRPAPAKTLPHLPDSFDFSYYQVAPEDQWLSHLLPGDVIVIYDVKQQPAARLTIPPDEAIVTGSIELQLRRDRVYIDMTRMQCTVCFRGFNYLDGGNHALHVFLGSAAKASSPSATVGVAGWTGSGPAGVPNTVPIDGTMGIGDGTPTSDALPFDQWKGSSRSSGNKRIDFQKLLRQQATAPVPNGSLDSTMALRGPRPPSPLQSPPPVPVAAPAAPASPAEPVAPPVMIGEVNSSPDKLEVGTAPQVAEELDLEMTAVPTRKAPPAPEPSTEAAPASETAPTASPSKPKKKDVRKALLRKMRRK